MTLLLLLLWQCCVVVIALAVIEKMTLPSSSSSLPFSLAPPPFCDYTKATLTCPPPYSFGVCWLRCRVHTSSATTVLQYTRRRDGTGVV